LINVFTGAPERQAELTTRLTRVTEEVMRHQPGFVSANMHCSSEGKRVDLYASLEQAAPLVESVPDIPVTYLAARPVDLPPQWPVQRMRALVSAKQRDFVDRFPKGRLVPVRASHDIDLEQPEIVIDELDRNLGF
jgi:hypothetical protein